MHKIKRAREAGMVAALIIVVVVAYMLFASPGLKVISDGTYEATLKQLHLTYPPQTEIENSQFIYENYDYSLLLVPGTPFIAYPAAVVRLLTQPFGINFSTWMLALAYILILAISAYLMVSGLYLHSRVGAAVATVGMAVLFMQSNITGYLNSLYDEGAVITAFALYVGCLVHGLCMPKRAGTHHGIGIILSGMFLLWSQIQMTLLFPFVVVGMILTVLHTMPKGPRKSIHVAVCGVMLFLCVQGTWTTYINSEEIHSDAANYLAVFQGYLTASSDPQGDLEAFGLDATYAGDIGRSYYEDSEKFIHDPRSESEQEALHSKITLQNRLAFCFANPQRIMQRIDQINTHLYTASNGRIVSQNGQALVEGLSPYLVLDLLVGNKGFASLLLPMLAAAVVCLILALIKKGGLQKMLLALSALMLGLMCYLPVCVAFTGGVDIDQAKVNFIFFSWAAFFIACTGGICLIERVCIWLSQADTRLRETEPAQVAMMPIARNRIHLTKKQLVWGSAIVSVAIAALLLLPQAHVGGVNNGDYGRMMEQIDLYWTPELLENADQQVQAKVIEEYTYREPFHPQRLTPADPTYSLIFPSMLVRAYSAVTGENFSTWILAWILIALTIASILFIIHDLYPRLGWVTLLLAIGLISMLLGENYVAWCNSLFGEGLISTSLIMTIACAVHLCVMERGAKKSFIWLLLLGISVRFLTCSKAQMALTLPMGLVLIAALAWYHRPKQAIPTVAFGLAVVIMMGGVSLDTYGIYKKNAGVSERQTVWQSVFYGALMIADDPISAMDELGIDPALAPDIGKHAYYPEADYVYPFNSEEMDQGFFNHVNTLTMVKYYLLHPKDFLYMLDRAAQESVTLHTGFMAYTGETYQDTQGLYRFNLWRNIRFITAGQAFWQYVLAYGVMLIYLIRMMLHKKVVIQNKLFALLMICVMLMGVIQYPLSVVGNGFADNNKQLYGFMLCHDLLVIAVIILGVHKLYCHVEKRETEQMLMAQERTEEA